MTMTTYRKLTLAEIYPLAHKQDLLIKQSEHFVNKIITNCNLESGYENMPFKFPEPMDNSPLIINTKPPQLYIVSYLKNNWKPLLLVSVSVGVLVSVYYNVKQRKENKKRLNKTPNTTNLYLVKKSM